jgi:hypothetical protein
MIDIYEDKKKRPGLGGDPGQIDLIHLVDENSVIRYTIKSPAFRDQGGGNVCQAKTVDWNRQAGLDLNHQRRSEFHSKVSSLVSYRQHLINKFKDDVNDGSSPFGSRGNCGAYTRERTKPKYTNNRSIARVRKVKWISKKVWYYCQTSKT